MLLKKIISLTLSVVLATATSAGAALVENVQTDGNYITISGKTTTDDIVGIYTMNDSEKYYGYQETDLNNISNIEYIPTDENGEYIYSTQINENNKALYVSSLSGEKDVVEIYEETEQEYKWQVFISPDGDDYTADGTYAKPYGTIEAAQAKVCEIQSSDEYTGGDIAINFLGGTYRIGTVKINEQTSGSADGRIVYRAYNDEEVELTNSLKLDVSELEPVTDISILKRLSPVAQDEVYVLDITPYISDNAYIGYSYSQNMNSPANYGRRGTTRLFLNEKPQTISRWPNVGYKDLLLSDGTSAVVNDGTPITDEQTGITQHNDVVLAFDEANIMRWNTADDMVIRSYLITTYVGASYNVSEIDLDKKQITLDNIYDRAVTILDSFGPQRRWYAENLLEEIDIPGEYFIDEANKKLYYYPAYELSDDDTLELVCGYNGFAYNMFEFKNASYVTFEGLNLEQASYKAMAISDSDNIIIDNCEIAYTHSNGVQVYSGCSNITVKNSVIHNTAGSGIYCASDLENEDIATLKNTGIVIENNHIYKVGENSTYPWPAIHTDGIGDFVKNNTLHQMPVVGVEFASTGGNFINNEVYMAAYDATDSGALHIGGDWRRYGINVEYNYIHDIGMEGMTDEQSTWPIAGIYWDEVHSGTTQNNNFIIHNSAGSTQGVFMNGGRDHTAVGNVIVGAKTAFKNPNTHSSYYLVPSSSDLELHPIHSGLTATYDKFLEFYNYAKQNNTEYYAQYGAKMNELAQDIEKYQMFSAKNLKFVDNVIIDSESAVNLMGNSGDTPLTAEQTRRYYYNNFFWLPKKVDFSSTVELDNYYNAAADKSEIFINPEIGDYRVSDAGKAALGISDTTFKLDKSFDISSIGYQNEVKTGDSFKTLYPRNFETVDTATGVQLVWERASFADEYEYTVYNQDKETVASGSTMYTNVTVDGLLPNSEYTWEVTAKYTSAVAKASNGGVESWQNSDGVKTFKTSLFEITLDNVLADSDASKVYYNLTNTGAERSAKLILASYDGEERLQSCKLTDITIPNGTVEGSFAQDELDFENEVFEAYVWTADGNITPLTSRKIYVK